MALYASYAWLIIGVLLFIPEVLATTMTFFFFGISAILVSILLFAGVDIGLAYQLLVFSVLSVCSLFLARKYAGPFFKGNTLDDKESEAFSMRRDIGDTAVAITTFHNGKGRVELNGSHWTARLQDRNQEADIHPGDALAVVGNESIYLIVNKEDKE